MAYAENTSVPVERSQGETKKILQKYGATAFAFAEMPERAMVQFEIKGKRIKFIVPLPVAGQTRDKNGRPMKTDRVAQATRSK